MTPIKTDRCSPTNKSKIGQIRARKSTLHPYNIIKEFDDVPLYPHPTRFIQKTARNQQWISDSTTGKNLLMNNCLVLDQKMC